MQEICCGEYVHARTLHFNNNNFASSYLVQVHLLRVLIGKMRIKIVSGAGGGHPHDVDNGKYTTEHARVQKFASYMCCYRAFGL